MSSTTDVIPDELILAAIDRAARHRERPAGYAITGSIYSHLDIPSRSGPARRVRGRLSALEEAGTVQRSTRIGFTVWSLTSAGRGRLTRAQRTGKIELPESPQHREWRNARTLAEQEIERFRRALRDCLTSATRLLDTDPPAGSDAFFEMAERLRDECRRLASATYCLSEWIEPDDATADVDDRLKPSERNLDPAEQRRLQSQRSGRRNVRLWSEQSTTGERN
jgi:hypothetical protein